MSSIWQEGGLDQRYRFQRAGRVQTKSTDIGPNCPYGAQIMTPKNHDLPLVSIRKRWRAARFYAATFPDSKVTAVHHAPGDYPSGKEGDVLNPVEFTVLGIPCLGLNGGPMLQAYRSVRSFQIATDNQAETDRYWNAIIENGGAESQCGWCKDRWGAFTGRSRHAC